MYEAEARYRRLADADGESAVVLDGNSVSCPNEDVTKLLKFEADLAVGVDRGPEETVRRGAMALCRGVADGRSSTLLVAGESAAGLRSFVEGDIRNEEPGLLEACTKSVLEALQRARKPSVRVSWLRVLDDGGAVDVLQAAGSGKATPRAMPLPPHGVPGTAGRGGPAAVGPALRLSRRSELSESLGKADCSHYHVGELWEVRIGAARDVRDLLRSARMQVADAPPGAADLFYVTVDSTEAGARGGSHTPARLTLLRLPVGCSAVLLTRPRLGAPTTQWSVAVAALLSIGREDLSPLTPSRLPVCNHPLYRALLPVLLRRQPVLACHVCSTALRDVPASLQALRIMERLRMWWEAAGTVWERQPAPIPAPAVAPTRVPDLQGDATGLGQDDGSVRSEDVAARGTSPSGRRPGPAVSSKRSAGSGKRPARQRPTRPAPAPVGSRLNGGGMGSHAITEEDEDEDEEEDEEEEGSLVRSSMREEGSVGEDGVSATGAGEQAEAPRRPGSEAACHPAPMPPPPPPAPPQGGERQRTQVERDEQYESSVLARARHVLATASKRVASSASARPSGDDSSGRDDDGSGTDAWLRWRLQPVGHPSADHNVEQSGRVGDDGAASEQGREEEEEEEVEEDGRGRVPQRPHSRAAAWPTRRGEAQSAGDGVDRAELKRLRRQVRDFTLYRQVMEAAVIKLQEQLTDAADSRDATWNKLQRTDAALKRERERRRREVADARRAREAAEAALEQSGSGARAGEEAEAAARRRVEMARMARQRRDAELAAGSARREAEAAQEQRDEARASNRALQGRIDELRVALRREKEVSQGVREQCAEAEQRASLLEDALRRAAPHSVVAARALDRLATRRKGGGGRERPGAGLASFASSPPRGSSGRPRPMVTSSAHEPAASGGGAGAAGHGAEAAPGREEVQGRLTAAALSGPTRSEGEDRPRASPLQPQPHPGDWATSPSSDRAPSQPDGEHGQLPQSPPPPPPAPPVQRADAASSPASGTAHAGEQWGASGADTVEEWSGLQSVRHSPGASLVLQRQLQSMKEALAVAEATSASLRSQLSSSGGLGSR